MFECEGCGKPLDPEKLTPRRGDIPRFSGGQPTKREYRCPSCETLNFVDWPEKPNVIEAAGLREPRRVTADGTEW